MMPIKNGAEPVTVLVELDDVVRAPAEIVVPLAVLIHVAMVSAS